MKIAYISFEYPPDTAFGGIATYTFQVAQMMKQRGHHVEVFAASPARQGEIIIDTIPVHHVLTESREAFPKKVVSLFSKRHQEVRFDVIESPEYMGDGLYIKKKFPSLPLIVKLHTPLSFALQLSQYYSQPKRSFLQTIRYYVGGVYRGKIRRPLHIGWKKKRTNIDYKILQAADQIHSPSLSLGELVAQHWNIDKSKVLHVPNPYIPHSAFLQIPAGSANKTVTYLGRLEVRKGIIELTRALPFIIEAVPGVKIKMVGKNMPSGFYNITMKEYMEKELGSLIRYIEFSEASMNEIPGILAGTDVCVFPSIWENFPNVCLEAMSAGRAIVASQNGGMKDMLEQPQAGWLVDPLQPKQIAEAVIKLLQNKTLRIQLGEAARRKVITHYNSDTIGSRTEACLAQLLHKKN